MTREDLDNLKLPDEPGVYFFRGNKREILYVGKAVSLSDRVRSYFAKDLAETRSPAIRQMVENAATLTYEQTDSVLEALILEANLIKQHQPPFNIASKDNKSFNYLVITKEEFPRVLPVRGRELFQKWDNKDIKKLFGPFPEGGSLKEALKIVRKIFPFRDSKCIPCGYVGNKNCKPCFNRQIGLCPGVCTGEMNKEEYALRVKHISDLFSGNFHGLKRDLAREMREKAKAEEFEKARDLRRQIEALEHVRDVSLIKSEGRISAGGGARVEAFDTAHTSGMETVAVMTVVNNGDAIKDAYRKFKIRSVTNDDIAALKEVLSRRLNHQEWPLPRVFVVDGGAAQLNAARRVLASAGVAIPLVGVVKNEAHKPERLIGDKKAIQAYERDILLANAEAHRFAIQWHRKRRQKALF
ncbi:MAG TPA: GIY-YIG nuclease family protein [Candidatus Paceibacterota bacterium]|nr:GIY-YIG nuclease family protein [Candidatus Paceibacterota bacterium]